MFLPIKNIPFLKILFRSIFFLSNTSTSITWDQNNQNWRNMHALVVFFLAISSFWEAGRQLEANGDQVTNVKNKKPGSNLIYFYVIFQYKKTSQGTKLGIGQSHSNTFCLSVDFLLLLVNCARYEKINVKNNIEKINKWINKYCQWLSKWQTKPETLALSSKI